MAHVMNGHDVFLTGAAGTGKSHVLRQIIKHAQNVHSHSSGAVAVVAPSGIAASQINGSTIHSYFRIPLELKRSPTSNSVWQSLVLLIIDEISMVHPKLFAYLNKQAQLSRGDETPFGGVQLVLCGDFFQLPPVERKQSDSEAAEQFVFQTDLWRQMQIKTVVLETVYRQTQDQEFLKCLHDLRTGEISMQTQRFMNTLKNNINPNTVMTQLCTHRHQVDNINRQHLQRLPGEARAFENHVQLHDSPHRSMSSKQKHAIFKSILLDQQIILKKKLRVMVVFNLKIPHANIRLVNGTLGTVVGFEKKTGYHFPIVQFARVTMVIRPISWIITHAHRKIKLLCLPLVPAFGLTIHKCQGCSLDDHVVIDISKVFAPHMIYVALSRVTDKKFIHLRGWKDNQMIKIHPAVRQFYRSLA